MENMGNTQYLWIDIRDLNEFRNHLFSVRRDEEMEKLVESIRANGILSPILVRQKQGGKYEIISGHRRTEAARILKMLEVPCIVVDLDDNHATLAMIDNNLMQRERILPSERAFALRERTNVVRRIMLQTKGRSENERATESVAEETGMSARQVSRYIKLVNLNRQLLNLLDEGKLSMESAGYLASLSTEEQCWVYDYITEHDLALPAAKAKLLYRYSTKNELREDMIPEILGSKKPKPEKTTRRYVPAISHASEEFAPECSNSSTNSPPSPDSEACRLDYERIRQYFLPGTTVEVMNDEICKLLAETYFQRTNRRR